jgi:hypothetical protein
LSYFQLSAQDSVPVQTQITLPEHCKQRWMLQYTLFINVFNQPTPSSESNISSANQESPHILCNQTAYYRIHNSVPLVPILSQLNPIHYTVIYLRRS